MKTRDRGAGTEPRSASDAEGPLQGRARRRREVAREEQALEARGENASAGTPDVREPRGEPPEPSGQGVVEQTVLTDEDMPALESLDEGSDYSGFLSPGVSEELRRRALRKLFMSAVFNVRDGLDDYDEDFTSFEALGDIVTSDMKHMAEVEAERAKQARADAEPATVPDDASSTAKDERVADAGAADPANEETAGDGEPAESPDLAGRESPDPSAGGRASAGADTSTDADETGARRT